MNSEQRFAEVSERLKVKLNVATDAALAIALGLKPNAFANRKKEGSIPHEQIVEIATSENLSLDWIYRGVDVRIGEEAAAYNVSDRRLEVIVEWLRYWWLAASQDERAWLVVEIGLRWPEAKEVINRATGVGATQ